MAKPTKSVPNQPHLEKLEQYLKARTPREVSTALTSLTVEWNKLVGQQIKSPTPQREKDLQDMGFVMRVLAKRTHNVRRPKKISKKPISRRRLK